VSRNIKYILLRLSQSGGRIVQYSLAINGLMNSLFKILTSNALTTTEKMLKLTASCAKVFDRNIIK
jgi:hypothetical protein